MIEIKKMKYIIKQLDVLLITNMYVITVSVHS